MRLDFTGFGLCGLLPCGTSGFGAQSVHPANLPPAPAAAWGSCSKLLEPGENDKDTEHRFRGFTGPWRETAGHRRPWSPFQVPGTLGTPSPILPPTESSYQSHRFPAVVAVGWVHVDHPRLLLF